MAWTVPVGCYYACMQMTSPYTVRKYSAGQSVPDAYKPSSADSFNYAFLLADFDNGYVYSRNYVNDGTSPLFTVDGAKRTVDGNTGARVGGIGGNHIEICGSPHHDYAYTDVFTDFTWGDGTGILPLSAFPSGVKLEANRTFIHRTDITSAVIADGVTSAYECFEGCTSLTSAVLPDSVTSVQSCFWGCTSLVTPPKLPAGLSAGVTSGLQATFYGCTALTTPPVIPEGTTSMGRTFSGCVSLKSPPIIPSSGTYMESCFLNCRSLAGNMIVNNIPTNVRQLFSGASLTGDGLYIINGAGTSAVETAWKSIASSYSSVHYEADDNTPPSVSLSVLRVDESGSKTPTEAGEYAYINAVVQIYEDYLPIDWTNELNSTILKIDGISESPSWTQTIENKTYKLECWKALNDSAKHSFSFQAVDDIKDNDGIIKTTKSSAVVTKILAKAYKLVDYYHESDPESPNYDTEGMSIGKFATEANLFDVDMPARFRDSVVVDRLVGEIKQYAGATVPTGWLECDGSEVAVADYPLLYAAIGTLWGTPSDSNHFLLPNLKGKVAVGYDSSDTDFDTVGENGGAKTVTLNTSMIPAHTHGARLTNGSIRLFKGNQSTTASGSISFSSMTKRQYNDNGTSTNSWQTATFALNHTHESVGGGAAHNNLQPYAVVKYIICAV